MPIPAGRGAFQLLDFQKVGTFPGDREVEPFAENPYMSAILSSPNLSRQAKVFLRDEELKRKRRHQIQEELRRLEYGRSKPPGVVSWIGGVPVGFQFGTAMGLTGLTGLLVDMAVDPLNLIGVGALTKVGRAAKFLQGASVSARVEGIVQAAKAIARQNLDKGFSKLFIQAAERAAMPGGNADELLKLGQLASKTEFTPAAFEALSNMGQGGEDLVKLLKNERRFRRDLKDVLTLTDKKTAIHEIKGPLVQRTLNKLRGGQRSFLSLGIPFVNRDLELLTLRNLGDDLNIQNFLSATDLKTTEKIVSRVEEMGTAAAHTRPPLGTATRFRTIKPFIGSGADAVGKAPMGLLRALSEGVSRVFGVMRMPPEVTIARYAKQLDGDLQFAYDASTTLERSTVDLLGGVSVRLDMTSKQTLKVFDGIFEAEEVAGKIFGTGDLVRMAQEGVAGAGKPSVIGGGFIQLIRKHASRNQIAKLTEFLKSDAGLPLLNQMRVLRNAGNILDSYKDLIKLSQQGIKGMEDVATRIKKIAGTVAKIEINQLRLRKGRELISQGGVLISRRILTRSPQVVARTKTGALARVPLTTKNLPTIVQLIGDAATEKLIRQWHDGPLDGTFSKWVINRQGEKVSMRLTKESIPRIVDALGLEGAEQFLSVAAKDFPSKHLWGVRPLEASSDTSRRRAGEIVPSGNLSAEDVTKTLKDVVSRRQRDVSAGMIEAPQLQLVIEPGKKIHVAITPSRKKAAFAEEARKLGKFRERGPRSLERQLLEFADSLGIHPSDKVRGGQKEFEALREAVFGPGFSMENTKKALYEFMDRRIAQVLKLNPRKEHRSAAKRTLFCNSPCLTPKQRQEALDAIESTKSVGVDAAGELVSPIMRNLGAHLAKHTMNRQSLEQITKIARDGEEFVKTLTVMQNMGDTPEDLMGVATAMEKALETQSRRFGNLVTDFVGDDELVLRAMSMHRDEPIREGVKGWHLRNLPEEVRIATEVVGDTLDAVGTKLKDDDLIDVFVEHYFPRILVAKTNKGKVLMGTLNETMLNRMKSVGDRGKPRKFHLVRHLNAWIEKNSEDIAWRMDAEGRSAQRFDVGTSMYLQQVGRSYLKWNTVSQLSTLRVETGLPMALIGNPRKVTFLESLKEFYTPEQLQIIGDSYKKIDHPLKIHENWRFHPSVAQTVKNMFDHSRFNDPTEPILFGSKSVEAGGPSSLDKFFNSLAFINEMGKSSIFRFSFVHNTNMVISLLPGLKLVDWTTGKVNFEPLKQLGLVQFKDLALPANANTVALKSMERIAMGSPGMGSDVKDASELIGRFLRSGSNVTKNPEFASFDHFKNFLNTMANKENPFVKATGRAVGELNDLFDKNLWDIKHQGMKFVHWVQQRAAFINAEPGLLTNPTRLYKVEREIAKFGDQMIGGLLWNSLGMLGHKKMRGFLSFALVAADWTTSNVLLARDFIFTMPGIRETRLAKMLTPDVLMADVRWKMARQYTLRAAIYNFVMGNALNYAFTGKTLFDADKEAYDPSTGFPRIELPWRTHDNRKQYMDIGSGNFTEPIEWARPFFTGKLDELSKFYFPKASTLGRLTQTVLMGYNPSWGQASYHEEDSGIMQYWKAAKNTVVPFVPITLQQASLTLRGKRDLKASILSSMGFSVRSESKKVRDLAEQERNLTEDLQPGGDLWRTKLTPGPRPGKRVPPDQRILQLKQELLSYR